eukprot:scaffold44420_cov66-Phaeocystis_antarctica.AAC.4
MPAWLRAYPAFPARRRGLYFHAPCFGARAFVPSAGPACGPFRATAAEREALGPEPALSRTSPQPTHSAPDLAH